MKPGDIVICTDARLSEGRLKEGWRYVVGEVVSLNKLYSGTDDTVVPVGNFGVILVGCPSPGDKNFRNGTWKSSRFRPLERKEIEDKVNSVIADKILAELAKEE